MQYTTAEVSYESSAMQYTTGWKASNTTTALNPLLVKRYLAWQDYLVFAISLSLPIFIGVFVLVCRWKKNASTEDFLVGERSINFVAVGLSLLGSLINGIFVLGTPAEIRYYGIKVVYIVFGILLSTTIISIIFVPKYQGFKFTSAYEYIEKRYNYPTRVVASFTFIASVVIYLAIVLYVPALAFEEVTAVDRKIIIAIAGVICTIYTAMGGMRAVVYTDALQMIILLIGLLTMAVLGAIRVGGGQVVWETALRTSRINLDPKHGAFNPDPRARNTFFSQSLGQGWTYIGLFVCNQMMIQRYMSVNTPAKAQGSLLLLYVSFIPIAAMGQFLGLVINATYEAPDVKCDPLVLGAISSADKIVPFFIMQLLGDYHGVPGVLIASIFSAALSSIASVINALSAVFLEDLVTPCISVVRKKPLTDLTRKMIAVCIVILFGVITIGLSFAAEHFTSNLVQAAATIWGVIDGPLAGIFIAGFFIPFCNSAGAISGVLGGLVIGLWISVGGIIYISAPQTLPVSACKGNLTIVLPPTTNNQNWFPLKELYRVNYGWFGVIGIFSSLIINIIVSFISSAFMELCVQKGWTFNSIRKRPASLMYSCADNVYCYCPESCKRPFRCGVEYEKVVVVNGELVVQNGECDNRDYKNDLSSVEMKEQY